MLSLSVVRKIDRLLQEGKLSHRKIADRLGVGRGTVSAIASGRRGLYGKELSSKEPRSLPGQSPAERCGRCGYLVHKPCLVCEIRDFQERRKLVREIQAAVARIPSPRPARARTRAKSRRRRSSRRIAVCDPARVA